MGITNLTWIDIIAINLLIKIIYDWNDWAENQEPLPNCFRKGSDFYDMINFLKKMTTLIYKNQKLTFSQCTHNENSCGSILSRNIFL